MKVVVVPSTPALLPEYASIEDPIADLRRTVVEAVAWLVEDGPAAIATASPVGYEVGRHLLADRFGETRERLLVVANGSATRTEKAPGYLDERAAAFDEVIGAALRTGDRAALAAIDEDLAAELWAMPDARAFKTLSRRAGAASSVSVDYDDAPYGVQYWVARWLCEPDDGSLAAPAIDVPPGR